MTADTHIYTSITSNYLPKARALAASAKRLAPDVMFHLVLSDDLPSDFDLSQEDFDTIIFADSLSIKDFKQWSFSHAVVELCTAVKGLALEFIFEEYKAERVFYFDPDMVLFSQLDSLESLLSTHSILLTPHQTEPEIDSVAVVDNEMCSLRHGVFNLGFVGVRNDEQGRAFSAWWAKRLLEFCYDDIPRGLFTDQKWVNLAPCFFDNIKILRSPVFNVATWNLTSRRATGSLEDGIFINDLPLGFYHFSGMDSGGQENMLKKYGKDSPILLELRKWYIVECERFGQAALGKLLSKYDVFEDGTKITKAQRKLYRERSDLRRLFPDPFAVKKQGGYLAWCELNAPAGFEGYRALQIPDSAGFADVVMDMANYFSQMARSGKVASRAKKAVLRLISGSMRFMVRLIR